MGGIAVGQSGIDALLIVGIGGVPEVEKESRHLGLRGWRERRDAVLDFFNAHRGQNTVCLNPSKRSQRQRRESR